MDESKKVEKYQQLAKMTEKRRNSKDKALNDLKSLHLKKIDISLATESIHDEFLKQILTFRNLLSENLQLNGFIALRAITNTFYLKVKKIEIKNNDQYTKKIIRLCYTYYNDCLAILDKEYPIMAKGPLDKVADGVMGVIYAIINALCYACCCLCVRVKQESSYPKQAKTTMRGELLDKIIFFKPFAFTQSSYESLSDVPEQKKFSPKHESTL